MEDIRLKNKASAKTLRGNKMWRENVLLVLVGVFVLAESSQVRVKDNSTTNPMSGLNLRTFHGRKDGLNNNSTLELPELNISDHHVLANTSGIIGSRIISLAYMFAIVLGIPLNTFVLAFLGHKTRHLSSAILYLSLAVSDLLLLLSLAPKVHYRMNGNDWVFGELACKLVTACFYGNMYCSIHAHMCISVLRYLAVVHPFLYRGLAKRSCTAYASLTVWLVFATAMTPELLVRQTYHLPSVGITTCHDVLPYEESPYQLLIPYRLCLICLGFVFPSLVIIFAYGSIVHQLSKSSCDFVQYIKASTVVFVIFLLCFTPSNVIHFMHYMRLYSRQQDDYYKYFNLAVCLCCFHSCLDPVLAYLITKTTNFKLNFCSSEGLREVNDPK